MKIKTAFLTLVLLLPAASNLAAQTASSATDTLQAPLYTPFVERYILDEIKALRVDLAAQKHELMQQILDREHQSVDRGVTYATDTITYFFYLIAGVSSILVIMGWTSMRDVHKRIKAAADERISKLIAHYEKRLENLERLVQQKTRNIDANREEIERTQGLQGLWLKAAQETDPAQKIPIYDEILRANPGDVEALTYQADAALELDEPQWATQLCQQALKIEPINSHALYQLACASSILNRPEDAIEYLSQAIQQSDSYRQKSLQDPALAALHGLDKFKALQGEDSSAQPLKTTV